MEKFEIIKRKKNASLGRAGSGGYAARD